MKGKEEKKQGYDNAEREKTKNIEKRKGKENRTRAIQEEKLKRK